MPVAVVCQTVCLFYASLIASFSMGCRDFHSLFLLLRQRHIVIRSVLFFPCSRFHFQQRRGSMFCACFMSPASKRGTAKENTDQGNCKSGPRALSVLADRVLPAHLAPFFARCRLTSKLQCNSIPSDLTQVLLLIDCLAADDSVFIGSRPFCVCSDGGGADCANSVVKDTFD